MISGDLTLSPKFLAGLKPGLLGHPADELDLEDQRGVRRDRGRGAGLSCRRRENMVGVNMVLAKYPQTLYTTGFIQSMFEFNELC